MEALEGNGLCRNIQVGREARSLGVLCVLPVPDPSRDEAFFEGFFNPVHTNSVHHNLYPHVFCEPILLHLENLPRDLSSTARSTQ